MNGNRIALAIAIIAAVTVLIRFLPFVAFAGRKTPPVVEYLGKCLPCAVMGMLVVYCLKDMSFRSAGGFVPQIIASVAVVLTYLWRKNTLFSIISGTLLYMLLVQRVF